MYFLVFFSLIHLWTWKDVRTAINQNSQTDCVAAHNYEIARLAAHNSKVVRLATHRLAGSQLINLQLADWQALRLKTCKFADS